MRLLCTLFIACVWLTSAYGQTQTPATVIPKDRVAETPALTVVVERLQYLGAQDVIFHFAFTNETNKDVLVITGYPQADKVIVTDIKQRAFTTTTISFLGVTPE